jgi:hypothetical protein
MEYKHQIEINFYKLTQYDIMNKFYTIKIIKKINKEELDKYDIYNLFEDTYDIDNLFEMINKPIYSCDYALFVDYIISLHKNNIKFIYNYKRIFNYFKKINQSITAKFMHPTLIKKHLKTGIDELQIYDFIE